MESSSPAAHPPLRAPSTAFIHELTYALDTNGRGYALLEGKHLVDCEELFAGDVELHCRHHLRTFICLEGFHVFRSQHLPNPSPRYYLKRVVDRVRPAISTQPYTPSPKAKPSKLHTCSVASSTPILKP